MARCGIAHEYTVWIVPVDDEGAVCPGRAIGIAGTLIQAVELAVSRGYSLREVEEGGYQRFVSDKDGQHAHFSLAVYAE